jgi:hypothetical protein
MRLRFLALALAAVALGATAGKPFQIIWHLDCPVVAHWCASPGTDACRRIRPSDEYDFVVLPTGDHKTAIVNMLATFPDSFIVPPTPTGSPTATAMPVPTPPSPEPTSTTATYTYTAVTWNLDNKPDAKANFVLLRSSQRLIVNTEANGTAVEWEGTCTKVTNKLLDFTPSPSPPPTPTPTKSTPSPKESKTPSARLLRDRV